MAFFVRGSAPISTLAALACLACLSPLGGCADAGPGASEPSADHVEAAEAFAPDPAPTYRVDSGPVESDRWFEDVTRDWGITHQRALVDVDLFGDTIPDHLMASVCPIDLDGRVPLDLFFARRAADGGSLLYVGRGVGDYVDETADRGLAGLGDVMGCLAFDADGDRDQDLFLVGWGLASLYLNEDGRLVEAPERLRFPLFGDGMYTSAAAGDLDGDGWLEIAVGAYVLYDPAYVATMNCAIPCAMEPGVFARAPNVLLALDARGRWVDVSTRSIQFPAEPTFVSAITDFTGDGRPEVYFGNDFSRPDNVFVRIGEGDLVDYVDRGLEVGIARNYRGVGLDTMGWSAGDLDLDGIEDHVVTAFEDVPSGIFMSRGDHVLEDESRSSGVRAREASFRWGAGVGDLDLDGDLDLVEAAGHYYTDANNASIGWKGAQAQPTNLYTNDGTGELTAVDPAPQDPLHDATTSRGLALVDLDDDGRLDVVIGNVTGPPQVLRNVRRGGHWLRVRLEGEAPNTEALGARVEVTTWDGRRLVRTRRAGEGFGGNFDPRLHFGFPSRQRVDVTVIWPNGRRTTLEAQRVDRELVIAEAR